jgi:hypothetical protein
MQSYNEDRAIAYADDGYINAPLSVALRILADLKQVLKDDAGLELNMLKTQLLVRGISTHDAYSAAKGFLENDARLTSIKDTIILASCTAEGYVGLGVPLGTDAFVQTFVHDACQKGIDDVDKLGRR